MDPIEQIYAAKILQRFPRYGEFWEKFIGVKTMGNYVLPYGVRIPNSIPRLERTEIRRAYEEINMAHYTLFCHLAGAHFQADRLSYPVSSPAKWFEHFEAFESAYIHLGSCFYQVHHLLDLLFLLRGQLTRSQERRIVRIHGGLKKRDLIKQQFRNARKLKSLDFFCSVKRRIRVRRDNLVHYARGASIGALQSVRVPSTVRPDVTWSRQLRRKRRYILTRSLVKRDLRDTELAMDSCHRVLIDALEEFLLNKGVRIQN